MRANQPGFPRLRASRKQTVAGYYLENGHTSLPPSATAFTGLTYWFGTSDPDPKLPLREVRAWTADGQGGNKKGRLLKTSPFDDGRCTQPNDSPVSKQRGVGKDGIERPCRSEFVIPENLNVGDVYTVYWVWDFSWHFGRDKPRVEEVYIIAFCSLCLPAEIIGNSLLMGAIFSGILLAWISKLSRRTEQLVRYLRSIIFFRYSLRAFFMDGIPPHSLRHNLSGILVFPFFYCPPGGSGMHQLVS